MELPYQSNYGLDDQQRSCYQILESDGMLGSYKRMEFTQHAIDGVNHNLNTIQNEKQLILEANSYQNHRQGKQPTKKSVPKRKSAKESNRQSTIGLKYYSQRVCDKVEKKGQTTYCTVADELVQEMRQGLVSPKQGFDEKNIRRRVYDAINVLRALKIIEKYQKDIRWIGLPQAQNQEQQALIQKRDELFESNKQKIQVLKDLMSQVQGCEKIVQRNQASQQEVSPKERIHLPVLFLKAATTSQISISQTDNLSELHFKSDQPYKLYDERDIIRELGLYQDENNDTETSSSETTQQVSQIPIDLEVAQFQQGEYMKMPTPEQTSKQNLFNHSRVASFNTLQDSPAQQSPFSYNLDGINDMAQYHNPDLQHTCAALFPGLSQQQMIGEAQNDYQAHQQQYAIDHVNQYSIQSAPCGDFYSILKPLQEQLSNI